MALRPSLDDLDLSLGKRTRLHRLLYEYGPGNGTLLFLPIDHGLEHGPRDFFANPDSLDPEYPLKLAKEVGFSGIVLHVGLAQKYMKKYAGQVPLVLKLNGKTNIPSDAQAFSPQTASVEDAVRLGADAVGYTIYVGSPAQDRDLLQFYRIREDCEKFGMPIIVWSYPRGEAIEAKGGRDSVYAVDYAARVADELGADCIKLNFPEYDAARKDQYPKEYRDLALSPEEAIKKVVKSAGKALVMVSGGGKISDEELIEKSRVSLEAGVAGFLFGRNLWQRKFEDGVKIANQLKKLMLKY